MTWMSGLLPCWKSLPSRRPQLPSRLPSQPKSKAKSERSIQIRTPPLLRVRLELPVTCCDPPPPLRGLQEFSVLRFAENFHKLIFIYFQFFFIFSTPLIDAK